MLYYKCGDIIKNYVVEDDIIMVTSRVLEMVEVLSMSYGANDYITNPYHPTILLLRISNIFKRMEKI